MKKRVPFLLFLSAVFLIPVSIFTGKYLNFDTLSAIIFIIVITILIIKNRKVLDYQPMIKLGSIPIIYAILWKTNIGIKFMEKIATKYRETVKLIGYSFIGFGFFGLIFISVNILFMLFQLFISPRQASEGVALVLPLTNVPGVGFLSFWHFLITLFVTVLIHEMAHGIVAKAHKVKVKSSGLGIFGLILPIFPLAFVEPDEKKMQKSSDVIQYSVYAAGPMINIIFAALVLLFMTFALTPLETNITHPVGFSFNGIMDNYSAQEQGMLPGTVINQLNGVDILDYQTFSNELGELPPGRTINLTSLEGTMYSLTSKPSPTDPERGYIGILDIRNERRMNEGLEGWGTAFFWFKGLIKWFYYLNLIIGLMNLLPLIVTDGGRMLKVAFEKIFSDKKKAQKMWIWIGTIFIFTLLFAMFLKYIVFGLLGFLF